VLEVGGLAPNLLALQVGFDRFGPVGAHERRGDAGVLGAVLGLEQVAVEDVLLVGVLGELVVDERLERLQDVGVAHDVLAVVLNPVAQQRHHPGAPSLAGGLRQGPW